MVNLYKKFRAQKEEEPIDALLALQMLEDQEQTKEYEFFQITEQIRNFKSGRKELETELPKLLKTKREQALYEALLFLLKTSQVRLHEGGGVPMVSQLGVL